MRLNADCMNKNKLSPLTNLSRKETDFCSKICECLFWLEESCLFLVEEIKKLLFREQTCWLLLFLIPRSSLPKKSDPPHSGPLLTPIWKYIVRVGVASYACSNIASIYNDLFNRGFRFSKDRDASEPNDGISNGTSKQRPTVQDTLFIEQVMYQKQNTERSYLQNFIVDEKYRIWCVCSWPIVILISDSC